MGCAGSEPEPSGARGTPVFRGGRPAPAEPRLQSTPMGEGIPIGVRFATWGERISRKGHVHELRHGQSPGFPGKPRKLAPSRRLSLPCSGPGGGRWDDKPAPSMDFSCRKRQARPSERSRWGVPVRVRASVRRSAGFGGAPLAAAVSCSRRRVPLGVVTAKRASPGVWVEHGSPRAGMSVRLCGNGRAALGSPRFAAMDSYPSASGARHRAPLKAAAERAPIPRNLQPRAPGFRTARCAAAMNCPTIT